MVAVKKGAMMTTVEMGSVDAGRAAARRFNGYPIHRQLIKIAHAHRR